MINFYLVDVLSNVTIDGEKRAFDFINTYITKDEAMSAAEKFAADTNTIKVIVHKWFIDRNGHEGHCGGANSVIIVKGV